MLPRTLYACTSQPRPRLPRGVCFAARDLNIRNPELHTTHYTPTHSSIDPFAARIIHSSAHRPRKLLPPTNQTQTAPILEPRISTALAPALAFTLPRNAGGLYSGKRTSARVEENRKRQESDNGGDRQLGRLQYQHQHYRRRRRRESHTQRRRRDADTAGARSAR
jgi:hypothetical protein